MPRPWELLPVPFPAEYDPAETEPDYFYQNFIKPLTKDFIRLMNSGLHMNPEAVETLRSELDVILAKVKTDLLTHPIIARFEEYTYPLKFAAFKTETEAKKRTAEYYLKTYDNTKMIHRTWVVNYYLDQNDLSSYRLPEWKVKDLKELLTILDDPLLAAIHDKSISSSHPFVREAMQALAEYKVETYNQQYTDKIKTVTKADLIPEFNPGSSLQLKQLFEFLEIEPLAFSKKTKEASWGRDQLQEVLDTTSDPEIESLLLTLIDYSNGAIVRSNFIEAFDKFTIDGKLYGNLNLFGAKTFRPTSNSPNLLNMPSTGSIYAKPLKKCFVAPEGYLVWSIDFSALEDRVIANLSGDTNKLSVFLEGIDGHSLAATYYFKNRVVKLIGDYTDHKEAARKLKALVDEGNKEAKEIRQDGKPVTFGLSYGSYPPKVAATIKCSIEEATLIFNAYHNDMFPDVTTMKTAAMKKAYQQGYLHLGLGCRLYSDDIEKDNRTLFNALSQFWSILTLIAVNELHHRIDEQDLASDIIPNSTIYDAIYGIVKADPATIQWLNNTIVPIMTKDFLHGQILPNDANLEIGTSWASLKELPHEATVEQIKTTMKELT